jgi:membrane-bound serine protease (ClpP class)
MDATWIQALLAFLTSPIVAPLLLSLGLLGLIFEIKAGHFGLGALVSVFSLGAFFAANVLRGLAGWGEIILLGLGLLAIAVEVFALPGFGVAGILGTILVGTATVLTLLGSQPGPADLMQAFAVLGASLVITGSVFYAWLRHLPNSTRYAGLLLKSSTHKAGGFLSAPVRDDLVGRTGRAVTDLRPAGTAQVGDERVDVVTEGEFVTLGTPITVLRSDGYRHVVRAANDG